jgi:addiction module HigA family antidote
MPEYSAKQPSKMGPAHPGASLRLDVLPALNLTVAETARQLGVSRQMLHSILAEREIQTGRGFAIGVCQLVGSRRRSWRVRLTRH